MQPDQARSQVHPAAPWRRRGVYCAGLLLVLGLAVLVVARVTWPLQTAGSGLGPPADPPLAALDSPFLNTRAGVAYVGDAACAGCHGKLGRAYHGHPMGRSFAPASPGDGLEHYPATFRAGDLRLSAERRGGQVFHRVEHLDGTGKPLPGVPAQEAKVQFAMGSGAQGRSYLVNRGGYLFESPLSWFTRRKAWDLSPGYERQFLGFGRAVMSGCVFCHCDDARPVEGTVNRYREPLFRQYAIGCERCHGPGGLHVGARRRGEDPGEVDHTIVNPRHLPPALREAVCQQCHLQGEASVERRGRSLWDYRPGLPLREFVAVFVKPPELADAYRAVGHAEQMRVSRCFTAGGGKLGCTSCHDPHRLPDPAGGVAYYRAACLKCHEPAACPLPLAERRRKAPGDNCAACHMPRADLSNIAHAAATDHRIPRSPGRPPRPPARPAPGALPLQPFHRDLVRGPDPEAGRDLGVALVEKAGGEKDKRLRKYAARRALPLLDAAVARAPGDAAAWQARGLALLFQDRAEGALPCFDKALARLPGYEQALKGAAKAALDLRRLEAARDYARRLVEVNPWAADYWADLARAEAARDDWPAVLAACRRALAVDPAHVEARSLLVTYHLERGERGAARAELDTLLALHPPNAEELRRWFAERTR